MGCSNLVRNCWLAWQLSCWLSCPWSMGRTWVLTWFWFLIPASYWCKPWEAAAIIHVIEFLPFTWNIKIEFLVPASLQAFGGWSSWWELALSLCPTKEKIINTQRELPFIINLKNGGCQYVDVTFFLIVHNFWSS